MNNKILTFGLLAGCLILAACAAPLTADGEADELVGRVWSLATLNGQAPLPGTNVTLQFTTDGKAGGSSGCNQYSGAYTVSGSRIEFSSLSSTMMACPQPVMEQESEYLKALGEARSFSVAGDRLGLIDRSGQDLLVFRAESQKLAGTAWQVIAYNNGKQAVTSVMAGSAITAEFGQDGVVSGSSGCNTYNGTYQTTGRAITIGPLVQTEMACVEPAGLMEQEAQYLAALQSAATFQVEGSTLELRTKDGALAVQMNKK